MCQVQLACVQCLCIVHKGHSTVKQIKKQTSNTTHFFTIIKWFQMINTLFTIMKITKPSSTNGGKQVMLLYTLHMILKEWIMTTRNSRANEEFTLYVDGTKYMYMYSQKESQWFVL